MRAVDLHESTQRRLGPECHLAPKSGPRRFNELRIDIPPISAKVLSARLKELQERRVLTRRVCDTSPPSVEYELTPLGAQLVPALEAIAKVGHALKAQPAA